MELTLLKTKDHTVFKTTIRHNSGCEWLENCRCGQISNIQSIKNWKRKKKEKAVKRNIQKWCMCQESWKRGISEEH